MTRRMHTWYGLTLTLRFYGTHWAAVGPMPPHPQLVNMILRIGLSKVDSLHLQILHELGHLQSLPLMILAGVTLFLFSAPVLPAAISLFVLWEVLSEAYVILREGRNYLHIYGIIRD
ncbi:MAG: hypothetical protein P1S46_05935 [bacterium]|nr:hypothetical protein [bacterium]MDT8395335.1 hypothetical protein [bacterium]